MSCNTLTNVKEDFKEKGLVGENLHSIDESKYSKMEALTKRYQAYAERKYGFAENLFTLKHKNVPDATATGTITLYSVEYNRPAFEKLDVIVEDYKVEESIKEAEQEVEAGRQNALNRLNNQGGQFINENGKTFDTIEELQEEDIADEQIAGHVSDNQIIIQPTYEDYVKHKVTLLKNIEKTISKLYNEKRLHNSSQVTSKILKFNAIKEQLEKDIDDFSKTTDKLALIRDFFQKDFDLINNLIKTPTLENIFLAKDLLTYIEHSADAKLSEKDNNGLFTPKANTTYSPEVIKLMEDLGAVTSLQAKAVEDAVDKIFLELLDKNRESLEKLNPGKSLEEIKDILLKKRQDISHIEATFFAVGENLGTSNNIIDQILKLEFEKEVLRESSKAQNVIKKIEAAIPDAEIELANMGRKIVAKLGKLVYSGYNYDFLYQKNENGDLRPNLIGKFSKNWENTINSLDKKHKKNIFEARQKKDWAEVEMLLKNRYNDLNDASEFVDLSLLHEIHNDPIYDEFKSSDTVAAEKYKQEIIGKIGQEEYENLVESQRNFLDNFIEERNVLIQYKLASNNVTSINDLADDVKVNLELSINRLNPLSFLKSHQLGRGGMIEFTMGTQSNEKPSYIKYNSVIPKATNSLGMDTNFYDKDFDMVADNPALYELWKAMREGSMLMSENLIDSNLNLSSNSLLVMKKKLAEEAVNKSFKEIAKEGLGSLTNLKSFVKGILSAKMPNYEGNKDDVVLSTQLHSFEGQVMTEFDIIKTELANIFGTTINDKTEIVMSALPFAKQEELLKTLGITNTADFMAKIGKDKFKVRDLRVFSENKIMEQQTLNIPLMMKAYLEISAEHKARTVSKNEVNIYREVSENILNEKNSAFSTANGKRNREVRRQDFFYDKVVLNKNQKDHNGRFFSDKYIKEKGRTHFDIKGFGTHYYKNFTKEEKIIYNSTMKRLETIGEPTEAKLIVEKNELEKRLRILGKDYLFSAIFDNVVNKLAIKVGLAYNPLANIKNRTQGLTSLLSRDGEFWTKGNVYPVNHFVGLNKTRFVRSDYKEEWDKMALFIKQLNIIQDGTNELQKAENKIREHTRWLDPMYGTEVVEYYNQISGILSMAMDMTVKHNTEKNPDGTAVEYPLFDGSSFTIYDNVDGILTLKPEFRTPENIAQYETMDSPDMINWKTNVEEMIRSLNGDYSATGVTQVKASLYTRPLMLFKTWIPRYISTRYKFEQQNIRTGNTETGYLISTFLNKKTSTTGALMLGVTGILGIMASSPAVVALPVFLGIIGAGMAKHYSAKKRAQNGPVIDQTEPIAIREQALFLMKAINPFYHLWEVPINTLRGKQVIQPAQFSSTTNLTEQEQKDIRLMMRNMQNTMILMLVKLGVQAMMQDNDDDEPKGKEGSAQRARYEAQIIAREERRGRFNFIENYITGMYSESSLAVEPTSLISSMGSKNGLESSLDKIIKMSTGLIGYGHGNDDIQKGPRAGQSKFWNGVRKFALPSLFRDIPHDTWRGGFETSMEKEWVTNEGIDGVFDSDYKTDKKNKTKDRNQFKLEYIEDYEERNNVIFEDLSISEQERLEKKAKKAAKKASGNPGREEYDEDQNIIEE